MPEQRPERHSVRRHILTLALALALALTLTLTLTSPNPNIKGAYPKGVNAQDARIKFRKRKPRLGGADETLLGVGGSEWPPLEHTQRTDALGLPACLVTLSCG